MYRNFFAYQATGVYVDIGANEALTLSNTAFFDICLGWKGACFEPQAQYHQKLKEARSCNLVPHCVLGRAANVTMAGSGVDRKIKADAGGREKCVGILDALQDLELGHKVDLLSIDIEGMEPDVLRCIPFDQLEVQFVLIETNRHDMRLVDGFFNAHGFANVATLWGHTSTSHRAFPLDNLYGRIPGGPLTTPSARRVQCSGSGNKWCGPFHQWLDDPKWGPCHA